MLLELGANLKDLFLTFPLNFPRIKRSNYKLRCAVHINIARLNNRVMALYLVSRGEL